MPDVKDFADALTNFLRLAREEGQTEEQIAETIRQVKEILEENEEEPRVSPTRVG
jgi:hypothetical protein